MNQHQLEVAWLGSILIRPDYCRSKGLHGLDHSFFSKGVFDLGMALLRNLDFREDGDLILQHISEPIIRLFQESPLKISAITHALDSMEFLPSCYSMYCQEIETRNTKDFDHAFKH